MNGTIETKFSCEYKGDQKEKYVEVHDELKVAAGTIESYRRNSANCCTFIVRVNCGMTKGEYKSSSAKEVKIVP